MRLTNTRIKKMIKIESKWLILKYKIVNGHFIYKKVCTNWGLRLNVLVRERERTLLLGLCNIECLDYILR
jgi:hypothetical protein